MTSMEWEFVPEDGQLFRRSLGEALARLVRARWPRNTAKMVARTWALDEATAQNVVRGHASERTISKAVMAEGWGLWGALGEALTGHTYEQHLQTIIEEADRARERMESRRQRLRRLEAVATSLVGVGDGVAHD